jgi:Tfp pilus assembly protein PilV
MTKASFAKFGKQGFTLVEVALAVLAVGFGLMTIIGLFPAGLQNASDDAADTRAGLFAGLVFSGMRGAATNADVNVWDGAFIGSSLTAEGVTLDIDATTPAVHAVKFPALATEAPENYLRYVLSLVPVTAGPRKIYSATLSTCDGQYGPFTTQNVFYTEFYYTGM